MMVSATMNTIAGRISFSMALLLGPDPSGQVQGGDQEVDRLDADERNDDAADTIDQEVAAKQRSGADRAVTHTFERQRDQRDDDQRVDDDRRENRALRGC